MTLVTFNHLSCLLIKPTQQGASDNAVGFNEQLCCLGQHYLPALYTTCDTTVVLANGAQVTREKAHVASGAPLLHAPEILKGWY